VKTGVFNKTSQAKKTKLIFELIKNYVATFSKHKSNLIAQNSPVLDGLNNLER